MSLIINSKAPSFELPSTSDSIFKLEDLKDPVILYFYPKDFTPACTKEACSFRDNFDFFKSLDIQVVGISMDNVPQHKKFKEKHKLPFELLSDVNGKVCKMYDALIPIIKVPKRVTYLVDQNKMIRGVYDNLFGSTDHISAMIKQVKQELKE